MMANGNMVAFTLLVLFITSGLCQFENDPPNKISYESSRTFNPFSVKYWVSIPSQFLQYWFPFFQSNYYPSYLRPSTPKPSTGGDKTEKGESKCNNIFGICNESGDKLEYLPPESQIEW